MEQSPPSVIERPATAAHDLVSRLIAGELDDEVLAWLLSGFRRYAAGTSLDQALRLDRASRLRARDQALRDAADILGPDGDPWVQAERLAAAVLRFERRVMPWLKSSDVLSPLDAAIWSAFRAADRVPRSQRQLYDLIR